VTAAAGELRASSRASVPAGQGSVRRNNLSLVLRHLRDQGSRSRADIAAETKLNKATVSSLIAELQQRGLVREAGIRQEGGIGRPARIVELAGAGVGALGLEVNADYVAAYACDLSGRVLVDRRESFDAMTASRDEAVARLTATARDALAGMARAGARPAGITVAVPGLVDVPRGRVLFAPNLHWRDVPLAELLAAALDTPYAPIRIDNDANLGALAEFWTGAAAGTADLVYVTGEVGIGGGIIVDGHLLRGADGFSGEVGHLLVDSGGQECGCGRTGCWETKVGLAALVQQAAPDLAYGTGPTRDPDERLATVLSRADAGDRRTSAALAEVGRWLGLGASILVNLFNPRVIVMGGYFARLLPYVQPTVDGELERLVLAGPAAGCTVVASTLGFGAAVRGGAGVAVEAVLNDPTTVCREGGELGQP
jgi:predicted NBD/HSP70 family sugar kinase